MPARRSGIVHACARVGEVKPVFVDQARLRVHPLRPGFLRNAAPDARAQFARIGRKIQTLAGERFPEEARAETLITKHASDIKASPKAHGGNIILKPLQGSGGSGVFKLDPKNGSNLNQIIEAIGRDGYIIAQAYVPAAKKGDIRLFLMNGQPLQIGGKYAALRRVAQSGPEHLRRPVGRTTSLTDRHRGPDQSPHHRVAERVSDHRALERAVA